MKHLYTSITFLIFIIFCSSCSVFQNTGSDVEKSVVSKETSYDFVNLYKYNNISEFTASANATIVNFIDIIDDFTYWGDSCEYSGVAVNYDYVFRQTTARDSFFEHWEKRRMAFNIPSEEDIILVPKAFFQNHSLIPKSKALIFLEKVCDTTFNDISISIFGFKYDYGRNLPVFQITDDDKLFLSYENNEKFATGMYKTKIMNFIDQANEHIEDPYRFKPDMTSKELELFFDKAYSVSPITTITVPSSELDYYVQRGWLQVSCSITIE